MPHWVPRDSAICFGYFAWETPVTRSEIVRQISTFAATVHHEGSRARVECPCPHAVAVAAACIRLGGTYVSPSQFGHSRYW